jgi:hypothetical protein
MRASILDLRRRMREVLQALDRNETVTILYRGRKKGVLRPATAPEGRCVAVTTHPAFGMWKDREDLRDVEQVVRDLRKGRAGAL